MSETADKNPSNGNPPSAPANTTHTANVKNAGNAPNAPNAVATPSAQQRVRWNTQNLKSSYVNFANANSTREEVVLNFGLNNTWDRAQSEFEIELAHRLVMSPFAAKRLSELMTRLIDEYESRHGKLT
jgi:spore germination protein YaaH